MDCASLQTPIRCDILHVEGGRAVCPVCGRRTRQRILPGTRLRELPLWCPHCRRESVVSYREPEPESEPQSQNQSQGHS